MTNADGEKDEFYMWIGRCITAWAKLEERLFKICWKSLRARRKQAAIVYFRTPSLSSRLTLTDELVKSVLPKPPSKRGESTHPSIKQWNDLQASIRSQLMIRSRIAHHPVRGHVATFALGGYGTFKGGKAWLSWHELYVSDQEQARGKDVKKKNVILIDLVDHDREVTRLADELKTFYDDVLLAHALKSSEPNPRIRRD